MIWTCLIAFSVGALTAAVLILGAFLVTLGSFRDNGEDSDGRI